MLYYIRCVTVVRSRNSAQSTGRRRRGGEQQFYGVGHVEQTVGELGVGQGVRGQRDHAQVVRWPDDQSLDTSQGIKT